MTQRYSRRGILTILAGLAATTALPALANAPSTSLRPVARGEGFWKRTVTPAETLVQQARLDGMVGFSVANATTGAPLEDMVGDTGLPPASVAKALTASYALETFGPAHRFVTQVRVTGGVVDGVVQGDLILAGGADPTLDTDGLSRLAAKLKNAGIREVRGDFLVWGGMLPYTPTIDAQQPDHVGYSPAVSGLSLNYNRVHFEWRRGSNGYAVTMDARSSAYRPDVTMARMQIVERASPLYTYANGGGRDDWTVARGALGKGGARWLPVRQPELYAGQVFQTFARAQGIALKDPQKTAARPDGAVVAELDSPALRIILRDMLKWSTNVTAEMVGMATTAHRLGDVASLRDSAQAMNLWAQDTMGLSHVALVDHSGLGDESRIAATDMCGALMQVRKRMGIKPLLKGFALRDANRKVIQDHPLKVHAKTGTLNFVSGLAGFVDLPDGTELVFAIFAADMPRRGKLTRAQRERPDGAAAWNRRAKTLQQGLIERWGALYRSS